MMAKFLAYTVPAAGHVFPIVPGLLALQAGGHEVRLLTAPDLVGALREAGLDARAVDVPRTDASQADAGRLTIDFGQMLTRGPLERTDLERAIADFAPDALLIDTNAYGAAVGAEASGLPWATLMPSLLPLPGRGVPPYGLGMAPMGGLVGRARDRLGWTVVERMYARKMLPHLNPLRAAAGLPALRSPIEHLHAPDLLITLTDQPLEYPRSDTPAHVRFVGLQAWDPPADAPGWLLEDGDPWVLVTLSTDYQGDEELARAAIEALRDEPVRVILTLGGADRATTLPRAGNVRVEKFVPHGPVLERAAAVVSHGGFGIVAKAALAGVPMVAVPFGRDQPEVARRVVQSGVGVRLPRKRLTAERLRAAVRESMAMRVPLVEPSVPGTAFAAAAEELAGAGQRAGERARAAAR
jgi:UDP:flavonoid glycosyltransferase YjiC (YdhE family)